MSESKQNKITFGPWPYFAQDEIDVCTKALQQGKVNYWTGQEAREFEKEFAKFCDMEYAISLANGTVALELALYALGVGEGDEVIVTPRTFMASISCAVMQGATPVFADIDRDTQNTSLETIKKVVTPKTKAIICVHLAGWPCEMEEIMAFANERGIFVIEDCAQAHGAMYKGKPVGSWGHIAAFSFCQDKIMTTAGEGGMLVVNDRELWTKAWAFKDHGKSFDTVYNKEHPPGFRWLHESFGTNWRISEMHAAVGRRQLAKLPEWLKIRRRNANMLRDCFKAFSCLRVPEIPGHIEHANYKYYAFVETSQLKEGWSRDKIMAAINEKGVPCYSGSCSEVYLEKAFDGTGFRPETRLPVAKELGETSLMFLVHPTIEEDAMRQACEVIRSVLAEANA